MPLPVDLRADDVVLDARTKELDLSGDVRVDASPFHLSSGRLHVWRSRRGVEIRGDGRLAFCPCLGAPLTLEFKGATVAPPGDLILYRPRLELYHVPIFWLPFFWLRSPASVGLLPIDVAYRGADGLFVGAGVHVPWVKGDDNNGLDLRAGAYVLGGFAAEARLRTDVSFTKFRVDDLRGDTGVTIEARGALAPSSGREGPTVGWDVDALRGTRAVVSTTELDTASRVFDHAAGEVTWREGGWTLASGVRVSNVRGTQAADLGSAGPVIELRRGEALGGEGAYDVRVEGGGVAGSGASTTTFARTGGGLLLAGAAGPLGLSASARGVADVGAVGSTQAYDAAGTVRAETSLPLERAYESSEPGDPWVHRIAPRVGVSAIESKGDELFGFVPGLGGVQGGAWVAQGGVVSAAGRWGAREAIEVAGDAGAVGGDGTVSPVARWRAAASGPWAALGAEGAHLLAPGTAGGTAITARARLGESGGLHVSAVVAGRDGVDPVVARVLTDAPLEPSGGFLATDGWTGGAHVGVPLGPYLGTTAGADADLTARELLDVRASIEFRDRCRCLAIRAIGAERVGRPGVDVWLTVDLVPGSR